MFQNIIQQAAQITNSAIVGFSTGKDSLVTLDLCRRYLKRVHVFFMYLVPGLEFQERSLKYYEQRFNVQILRLPHWQLAGMLSACTFRNPTSATCSLPNIKITDAENLVRERFGCDWIAYGLKKSDSLSRRPWLEKNGGIDHKKRTFYPVADFTDKAIYAYLRKYRLPLPVDYRLFGRSFGRLWAAELQGIKSHFPDDYRRILEVFPYAEAEIKRIEYQQLSKI